jgi:chaperone required for assembly of F1-ATPase
MFTRNAVNKAKTNKSSLKRAFAQVGLNHMTKFYKTATVEEYTPADDMNFEGTHWTVALDGKKLKTPDGHQYFVPSKALAEIVALEFNAQEDYLRTSSMPMFGISKAAIDVAQSQKLKNNSYLRLSKFIRSDTVR